MNGADPGGGIGGGNRGRHRMLFIEGIRSTPMVGATAFYSSSVSKVLRRALSLFNVRPVHGQCPWGQNWAWSEILARRSRSRDNCLALLLRSVGKAGLENLLGRDSLLWGGKAGVFSRKRWCRGRGALLSVLVALFRSLPANLYRIAFISSSTQTVQNVVYSSATP